MKRISSVLFALAVVVTTTSTGYAQCSNATLTGNYPFIYSGANAPARSVTGKNTFGNAAVGVLTFDGAGNLPSITYTAVFNGNAFSTSVPDTGTYTVNSDCTGTLTDASAGIHFNIVTAGGGAEVFAIQTDAGATDTFDAKKQ